MSFQPGLEETGLRINWDTIMFKWEKSEFYCLFPYGQGWFHTFARITQTQNN